MSTFKELTVWTDARRLAVEVYELTKTFPGEERYGLTAQMRRAAVSVSSNIAEGKGRGTFPDFRHFLRIARGSANEVQSQLEIAIALGMIDRGVASSCLDLSDKLSRGLFNLIRKGDNGLGP